MNQNKILLLIPILSLFGLSGIEAQETVPASGGNAVGGGGTVSYSVGQVVYTTNSGTTGSMAQGVQQPYEISVVMNIAEESKWNIEVAAFPNPTAENLLLTLDGELNSPVVASLFDANGKLLENKTIAEREAIIAMENLAPGTYFLKIFQGDKEVKTFQVIKN